MKTRFLTNEEKSLLCTALKIAREQFEDDAKTCRATKQKVLASQFDRQAEQAGELYDLFFSYPDVEVDIEENVDIAA